MHVYMISDILGSFMVRLCPDANAAAWERRPPVISCPPDWTDLTVKSSRAGYELTRLGSILNAGYCFWALNKPSIVPQGLDGIKAAI